MGEVALPVIDQSAATNYFAGTVREAAWTAVADPDAQLTEARRWLGALCFDQTKDCCGRVFDDAYLSAVCELALALSQNPSAVVGSAAVATGATKRQKLGEMEVEYFEAGGASAGARYGARAPYVLQRFPWLGDIIGCWLNVPTGSSRILARVRS